jgi:hypothetical protein
MPVIPAFGAWLFYSDYIIPFAAMSNTADLPVLAREDMLSPVSFLPPRFLVSRRQRLP